MLKQFVSFLPWDKNCHTRYECCESAFWGEEGEVKKKVYFYSIICSPKRDHPKVAKQFYLVYSNNGGLHINYMPLASDFSSFDIKLGLCY